MLSSVCGISEEGTALTYETLTWDAPAEAGYGLADLRAAQRQAGEYEAAIPASIAELAVSLPAAVLADAEEASNEITRFDAELGDEVAPFAAVLLRSESTASSNIENLTASARAIAEAEALGDTSRRNAALIVSNTEAMKLQSRWPTDSTTERSCYARRPHAPQRPCLRRKLAH